MSGLELCLILQGCASHVFGFKEGARLAKQREAKREGVTMKKRSFDVQGSGSRTTTSGAARKARALVAAGWIATLLAVAAPADAFILYTDPTDVTISLLAPSGEFINFDPTTGSVVNGPFHFKAGDPAGTLTFFWNIIGTNAFISILVDPTGGAPRLAAGDPVAGSWWTAGHLVHPDPLLTFPWEGGGTGYLGLRYPSGYDFLYGWVRVTYDAPANTLTLHDFALEMTPNALISAGDTGSPVPEPGTLVLLAAAGAAGMLVRRKKSKSEASR
jgi:hypothetical protein